MYAYEYYQDYDAYLPSYVPCALVSDATINVENDFTSDYMFNINGIRVIVRPMGGANFNELNGWEGTENYGVEMEVDPVTGDIKVTGDKMLFEKDITYFVAKNGAPARMKGDNNMRILTADDVKAMQKKLMPLEEVRKAVVLK
jgi:hypothetical protein